MYPKNLKASLILIGVGLLLPSLSLQAQQQTGSVLSRVQTVEDPELGDLIRAAIENCERTGITANGRLKLVQDVTESYAKIKLLDEQIEQTARKIKGDGSGGVLQEMALAKAELESKRMIELAKLRQIMQVIPAHAFARRPVSELKTWLHLDALGDRIIVYTSRRPFDQRTGYSLAGVMSKNAAMEYVAGQMKGEDRLPIRIDIYRTVEGLPLSEQLNSEIVQLVKKTNIQMQAEVHLEEVRQGASRPTFFVEKGKVGTGYGQANGGVRVLAGIIEPNDLDGYIGQWILRPQGVPAVFAVEYGPGDEDMAHKVSQAVGEVAKRFGVAEFIQVKGGRHEPTPQELYAGRWQAEGDGEFATIELEANPNRAVVYSMDRRVTRSCQWTTEEKTLVLTGLGPSRIRGNLDAEGRLVIVTANATTTLRKEE